MILSRRPGIRRDDVAESFDRGYASMRRRFHIPDPERSGRCRSLDRVVRTARPRKARSPSPRRRSTRRLALPPRRPSDDDKIIAICGPLIDGEKTSKADRIKALIARAGAYDRKDQIDRAIGD